MQLDATIVAQHEQLYACSCIPMSVELVLKLLHRVRIDYYDLQREWNNREDGTFAVFDGRTIEGVRFRRQFNSPRGDNFPLDELFRTIRDEVGSGRFVIASLESNVGWHMWVVYDTGPDDEFRAVSRVWQDTEACHEEHVRLRIQRMKGTDILTYVLVP